MVSRNPLSCTLMQCLLQLRSACQCHEYERGANNQVQAIFKKEK